MKFQHWSRNTKWITISTITVSIIAIFGFFAYENTVIADCAWSADAKAWVDENQNKIWDSNESPLPNVVFHIDDVRNSFKGVGRYSVSDNNGEAKLSVWLPGCPRVKFVVYAESPINYLNTTPNRINAKQQSGKVLSFGYIYSPDLPPPTPRPSSTLTCTPYEIQNTEYNFSNITDIAVAPDGSTWVGANGVALLRFLPKNQKQIVYTTENGLPDSIIRSIAIAPNGMVWVGTNGGASLFNGKSWITYTENDGLAENMVEDIVVSDDGSVWFATYKGVSKFTPSTGTWITDALSQYNLTSDYFINAISHITDNSFWFVSDTSIYQLRDNSEWNVIKRDQSDKFGGLIRVDDLIVSDEETLWFSGSSDDGPSIVNFNPHNQETKTYNYHNTGGSMVGGIIKSLVVAPDETLWIGLYGNGLLHFTPAKVNNNADFWVHYTSENGLNNNNVLQVAVDLDGYIWVGTETNIGDTDANVISRCSIAY